MIQNVDAKELLKYLLLIPCPSKSSKMNPYVMVMNFTMGWRVISLIIQNGGKKKTRRGSEEVPERGTGRRDPNRIRRRSMKTTGKWMMRRNLLEPYTTGDDLNNPPPPISEDEETPPTSSCSSLMLNGPAYPSPILLRWKTMSNLSGVKKLVKDLSDRFDEYERSRVFKDKKILEEELRMLLAALYQTSDSDEDDDTAPMDSHGLYPAWITTTMPLKRSSNEEKPTSQLTQGHTVKIDDTGKLSPTTVSVELRRPESNQDGLEKDGDGFPL
ncbi:hypothetical protein Tco_1228269 [Tanacetum coccineum]